MTPSTRRAITVKGGPISDEAAAARRRTCTRILADARRLTSVWEAESFASQLFGQMWQHRAKAPPLQTVEPDLVLAGGLVQELAGHGGRGSKLVLHAIGRLARGELGALASRLADEARGGLPAWTREIGRSRVVAASGHTVAGDGTALLLEVDGVGMIDHRIAVFIDDRHDGYAKHLRIVYRTSDLVDDAAARGMAMEPRDPADACAQVLAAIAVTDARSELTLGGDFAAHRLLVVARALSAAPARPMVAGMN